MTARAALAAPAFEAPPRPAGRLIAIASGKGGVGKTWLAISLSQALAERRRQVLLVDGDLGLANVDVQIGLSVTRDVTGLLRGERVEALATPVPDAGFSVLAGRSGSGALAALAESQFETILTGLSGARGYDHVVLDIGAGLDRTARRLAAFADTLLVVTTEEPTALTDAYACLKLAALDRPGGDRRVVVNMAVSQLSGERTWATLRKASETFLKESPPLAGVVRRDARVAEAIRRQVPFLTRHPTAEAASDLRALAALLAP
ncbi:AAA family ATPase [Elioraea tepida]|jgi:flagellar biosynthesis protein FlhG|uniref:AAA family ATPase n=1 Tax=Elioraea tepida TaxID=2843330 RepID=A0A975U282_9PROT|nr:AAA family ATPase [Elioraea tepida]QXM24289.1 AAA family ATPase [Elioraea tepida]